MKKAKMFLSILVLCLMVISISFIYADEAHFPTGGTPNSTLTTATRSVWGTIVRIVQMLSFGAILFTGLRYMFAAPEARADIKKSLGVLALGAFIVFAASTIVEFVTSTANSMLQ